MANATPARSLPILAAVAFTGVAFTVVVAIGFATRQRERAAEWLDTRADLVNAAIHETLDDTVNDLAALAGFLEAQPDVSNEEFARFAERIEVSRGVVATAYVRAIRAEEIDEFVSEMRRDLPEYRITEFDNAAQMVDATGREVFYPVQFMLPGPFLLRFSEADPSVDLELAFGFDAASSGEWAVAIEDTVLKGERAVSDFFSIGYLNLGKAFVILDPVYRNGDVAGVVGAVALDVLLTPELGALNREIQWEIRSPGAPPPPDGPYLLDHVQVAETSWELVVQPTKEARAALAGFPSWGIVGLGLLATMLLTLLTHETLQRTRDRRAIAALQQAAEDKDRFLAAVSHEIRTPLTVVAGFSHELQDGGSVLDAEERKSILTEIATQTDEMTGIIEDLLVAARTDIRNVTVHQASIDLRTQVLQAVPPMEDHEVVVAPKSATAFADPGRVRQIVRNLLTNARRYGGPRVEVTFRRGRDTVACIVADNGSPIPEKRQQAIFEPYRTAHPAAAGISSIGLGLFISRELARLMGGDLTYNHDGKQSRFELTLPAGVDEERIDARHQPVPSRESAG